MYKIFASLSQTAENEIITVNNGVLRRHIYIGIHVLSASRNVPNAWFILLRQRYTAVYITSRNDAIQNCKL